MSGLCLNHPFVWPGGTYDEQFTPAYVGTHYDACQPGPFSSCTVLILQGEEPQRETYGFISLQAGTRLKCASFYLPSTTVETVFECGASFLTNSGKSTAYYWDQYCAQQPDCPPGYEDSPEGE